MRLCVVIPVGPGHGSIVERARDSVQGAVAWNRGSFEHVGIVTIDDSRGSLGRSEARNLGISAATDADWIFLLDADDIMLPEALECPLPDGAQAVYGPAFAQYRRQGEGKPQRQLASPEPGWDWLMRQGPVRSYMMGNFYRAEALRRHLFRTDLDHGEDWEHHLSFMARFPWEIAPIPLAMADTAHPSASGPRGGKCNWAAASEPFFKFWRSRGRIPLTDEERKGDYWK